MLDGRPVVVVTFHGSVRVWDLATGTAIGGSLTGHVGVTFVVATTVLDGRQVAVTGSDDGTVRVWDLTTVTPIGDPLTGHIGTVNAVATTVLDGRPLAVTGSSDHTVRVWDLATATPVGSPFRLPNPCPALAVAPHDPRVVVVCFGNSIAALALRPHT